MIRTALTRTALRHDWRVWALRLGLGLAVALLAIDLIRLLTRDGGRSPIPMISLMARGSSGSR